MKTKPLNYLLGGLFMVMVMIITTIKMQMVICILGILLPCDLQFGTSQMSNSGWEQPPGLTPCMNSYIIPIHKNQYEIKYGNKIILWDRPVA
jgi:hypothetical protein